MVVGIVLATCSLDTMRSFWIAFLTQTQNERRARRTIRWVVGGSPPFALAPPERRRGSVAARLRPCVDSIAGDEWISFVVCILVLSVNLVFIATTDADAFGHSRLCKLII